MAHYGTLHNTAVEFGEDVRGSHLYGTNDDKLGKIDDVIFDHSSGDIRYVVVDTGGWLKSKKFIVPADRLRASSKHDGDYEASLTRQQVESFPPYNEKDLESEKQWNDYQGKYRSKWVSDPVMHRAETDRNITPTTYQAEGNYSSESAEARTQGTPMPQRTAQMGSGTRQADLDAANEVTERAVPAGHDSVVISNSGAGIGGRWDTFQSQLRERRKEAVLSCRTCTGESAQKRGSESAGSLRKAV